MIDQTDHLKEPDKGHSKQYIAYFQEKFSDRGQDLLPIINQIPLAICVTNSEGIFEQVNDAYCALYQYSREELVGQHFTKVVPEVHKAKLTKLYEQLIQNKESLTDEWNVQGIDDDTSISIIANAAYIKENGHAKRVAFIVDISNTKTAEAESKKTVRKLNALMLTQKNAMELLLHDLRGPMSNVLSLAEFLSKEDFTSTQKDTFAKRLQHSAQRAFDLTNRLYGIIQIENGKYNPTLTIFDLHQLIDGIWKDLNVLVSPKQVTLARKTYPESRNSLLLNADVFLVNIIFYNLIKNAVEASPINREVTLSIKVEKVFLKVEIHNEGGIPSEVQADFFQKYITSGKVGGSGLGTYMVKKITNLLKSKVSFKSSAEGTILYLKFPSSILHQ